MKSKVNEISISYSGNLRLKDWPKITCSNDAVNLLYENWEKGTIGLHESFKILLLNNSNKVKGIYTLSSGGITGTLVDVRMLFAVLLKSLSTAVILAHNHPSGNTNPSEADKQLTQKISKGGEYMDIKILDHLILTPDGPFFSFADEGLL